MGRIFDMIKLLGKFQLKKNKMRVNYNIPIVVIAHNRPKSLDRLLKSLQEAEYSRETRLIISIDGGENVETIRLAKDFSWRFGIKEIIIHEKNLGIREHVLSCGDIALKYDGIVLLEDDLFVSPVFYHFVTKAIGFYEADENIGGFSLYSHQYNETAQLPFKPVSDASDVFFFQYASSWGQFYTKRHWNEFKEWYMLNENTTFVEEDGIPPNILNWPDSSWKKYFIEYIIEKDKYFVFPRVSLTTNFGDPGFHMDFKEKYLQVPLQYEKRKFNFKNFNDSNCIYDVFCEILPKCLKKLAPHLAGYDFGVDLFGIKKLSTIHHPLLLTTKKFSSSIISFAKEMKPLEANVIENLHGNEIGLTRMEDCEDPPYASKLYAYHDEGELLYHYNLRFLHLTDR